MRTLEQLAAVKIGDMTSAERRLVFTAACRKLEREMGSPAVRDALAKVLAK
jgi:hypothetical protein